MDPHLDVNLPITWSPDWEIGIPLIDAQHRRLVEMAENLRQTVLMEQTNTTKITKVLKGLITYCADHFECEQMLMQMIGYPTYDAHLAKHRRFTAQTLQWFEDFQTGQLDPKVVMYALMEWLIDHILHNDTTIVKCCQQKGVDYTQFRSVSDVIPRERRSSIWNIPLEYGIASFLVPAMAILCWMSFHQGTASFAISGLAVAVHMILYFGLVLYVRKVHQLRIQALHLQSARQLADNLLAGEIAKRIVVMDLDDIDSLIAHETSPLVLALQDIVESVRLYLPFIPDTVLAIVRGENSRFHGIQEGNEGDDMPSDPEGDAAVVEDHDVGVSGKKEGGIMRIQSFKTKIAQPPSGHFASTSSANEFCGIADGNTSTTNRNRNGPVVGNVSSHQAGRGRHPSLDPRLESLCPRESRDGSLDHMVRSSISSTERLTGHHHTPHGVGNGGSGIAGPSGSGSVSLAAPNPLRTLVQSLSSGSMGTYAFIKEETGAVSSATILATGGGGAGASSVAKGGCSGATSTNTSSIRHNSGSSGNPLHFKSRPSVVSGVSGAAPHRPASLQDNNPPPHPTTPKSHALALTTTWLTKRNISLLMIDITWFHDLAASIPTEELLTVHTAYVTTVETTAKACKGRLNTILGDRITLSWNAANSVGNYAQQACKAALKLKEATPKLDDVQKHNLQFKIAVGTGNALVGNMGSKSTLSFSIVGPVSIITSALCKLNGFLQTDVLICSNTWRNAKEFFIAKIITDYDIACSSILDDMDFFPPSHSGERGSSVAGSGGGGGGGGVLGGCGSAIERASSSCDDRQSLPASMGSSPSLVSRWISQNPSCIDMRSRMYCLQLLASMGHDEGDEWMYVLKNAVNPYEAYNTAMVQILYGNFAKGHLALKAFVESYPQDRQAKELLEYYDAHQRLKPANSKTNLLKWRYGWHQAT